MSFKAGIGYDVHRLKKGRKLILGGVEIPFGKGLEGHSDADVLVHAICDALLGAAGLGDIGEHFPPSEKSFKGISSLKLLKKVQALVLKSGYTIGNVDSVVLAEAPTLQRFKTRMRRTLAQVLKIPPAAVNIKATTQERLGFIGQGQGIAAYAIVVLKRK